MASGRRAGNGPGSLYATMVARPIDDILGADTRGTNRERLVEAILAAVIAATGQRAVRIRRDALHDALEAGRRVSHRYERGIHVFSLPDDKPAEQTDTAQGTLT